MSFGDQIAVAGDDADVDMWAYGGPTADVIVYGDIGNLSFGDLDFTLGEDASVYWKFDGYVTGDVGNVKVGDISADVDADAYLSVSMNVGFGGSRVNEIGDITIGDTDVVLGENADIGALKFSFWASDDIGLVTVGDMSIDAGAYSSLDDMGVYALAGDDIDGMELGNLSILAAAGSEVDAQFTIVATGGEVGYMTAGDITITAQDGVVTADMVDGAFTANDIGKPVDGAQIYPDYGLFGDGDGDLTIGNITVTLDTLSQVDIDIDQSNSGDVFIGNLTVSGAVGTVSYSGTASNQTGSFVLDVGTPGDITIGNVDYSGYTEDATIDLTWTDFGAATITGSPNDDMITGNNAANIIWGGKGQDELYGSGGTDTFAFQNGDSGISAATIDRVQDWNSSEKLKFNLVNGSATNYVEDGTTYGDIASFLDAAADALDSTVKYFAAYGNFGSPGTYVAVNYGSGEADLVVELVGQNLSAISSTNIIA